MPHRKIFMRAAKGPFDVASAEETHAANLIAQNSGNLVFSNAAYKILCTSQTEITVNRMRIDLREVDMINEQYDIFVIPLANAFRRSYHDRMVRLTEFIERLKIPVMVFGVGVQTTVDGDRERLRPLDDMAKRFAKAVLDRSPSIGVRGEITADYLRGLGFRDVDVIGCPSMFFHGDRLHVEKKKAALDPQDRIAINISPYVKAMGKIVTRHHLTYPNLRYIAQDLKTLETLLWGDSVADRGKKSDIPIYTSHPLYQEDKVRFFVDPWTWMAYLSTFEFSFGTRIHGNITALISGVPAYVFAHDSRTLELARYFEIPHKLMRDVPPDVDAAQLYEEADYSALNNGHKARFQTMVDFLKKHNLDHSFADGDSAAKFDERGWKTNFPPAVRPITSVAPPDVVERMRWLKDSHDELRMTLASLTRGRVARIVFGGTSELRRWWSIRRGR